MFFPHAKHLLLFTFFDIYLPTAAIFGTLRIKSSLKKHILSNLLYVYLSFKKSKIECERFRNWLTCLFEK